MDRAIPSYIFYDTGPIAFSCHWTSSQRIDDSVCDTARSRANFSINQNNQKLGHTGVSTLVAGITWESGGNHGLGRLDGIRAAAFVGSP